MGELLKKYVPVLGSKEQPEFQDVVLSAHDIGQCGCSDESLICRDELISLFEDKLGHPTQR